MLRYYSTYGSLRRASAIGANVSGTVALLLACTAYAGDVVFLLVTAVAVALLMLCSTVLVSLV